MNPVTLNAKDSTKMKWKSENTVAALRFPEVRRSLEKACIINFHYYQYQQKSQENHARFRTFWSLINSKSVQFLTEANIKRVQDWDSCRLSKVPGEQLAPPSLSLQPYLTDTCCNNTSEPGRIPNREFKCYQRTIWAASEERRRFSSTT